MKQSLVEAKDEEVRERLKRVAYYINSAYYMPRSDAYVSVDEERRIIRLTIVTFWGTKEADLYEETAWKFLQFIAKVLVKNISYLTPILDLQKACKEKLMEIMGVKERKSSRFKFMCGYIKFTCKRGDVHVYLGGYADSVVVKELMLCNLAEIAIAIADSLRKLVNRRSKKYRKLCDLISTLSLLVDRDVARVLRELSGGSNA